MSVCSTYCAYKLYNSSKNCVLTMGKVTGKVRFVYRGVAFKHWHYSITLKAERNTDLSFVLLQYELKQCYVDSSIVL